MRHLIRVEVKRLLGRFDHTIDIPADWDFAILHGPNGVGKTKILQLITYGLSLNAAGVRQIPFDSATFTFDDNHALTLEHTWEGAEADHRSTSEVRSAPIRFVLEKPDGQEVTWAADEVTAEQWIRIRRYIERETPIRRVAPDLWRDSRLGDMVSMQELVERYAYTLPAAVMRDMALSEVPDYLRDFCESVNVHLIETQRLTTRDSSEEARRPGDAAHRATVVQYADDLRSRLQHALASNSRTTQLLDRSFPKRVLEEKVPAEVDDNAIRERYEQQSRLRTRLSQIALLEDRTDLPLPNRKLQDWERRVLWTYLDDTDSKLATFEPLLVRVDALREIIKSRFLFKELVIDAERGFRIVTDEGVDVPPPSLSSGEQHELILIYDLLFNAPSESLVLIDEPEISLHVAWQQRFLADMAKISEIASLRFLVATHSPQIINKWWSRTVRLTPQHDGIDEFDEDAPK